MAGRDDRTLRCPYEGNERESGNSDCVDYETRTRVNDANGAIMTFWGVFNISRVGTSTIDLPANASTSPEGEKATVCTQPPAGVENSPQTVPNGSFSPHTVGAGLEV